MQPLFRLVIREIVTDFTIYLSLSFVKFRAFSTKFRTRTSKFKKNLKRQKISHDYILVDL